MSGFWLGVLVGMWVGGAAGMLFMALIAHSRGFEPL